jgi:Na+/proline symporter
LFLMCSTNWWIAAVVSTAIPAFYCFTGGMRASLFTDVFQVGVWAPCYVASGLLALALSAHVWWHEGITVH